MRDRQGLQTFVGADTQCSRCHAEPHRFTTRSLEACERCHTSRTWHQLRDTLRFDHDDRKDARMPLVGAHEDVPCRDCHANAVFGFGLAEPDRCTTCHQSPHAGHLFDKLDDLRPILKQAT